LLVGHAVNGQCRDAIAETRDDDWPPGAKFGKAALDCNMFGLPERGCIPLTIGLDHGSLVSRRVRAKELNPAIEQVVPLATFAVNTGVFTVGVSKYHDTMTNAPKDGRNESGAGDDLSVKPRDAGWTAVPGMFRRAGEALPAPWGAMFEPLRRGLVDDLVVVGQFGQSIDGRIATVTGHSKYINGAAGLAHLHRLRALVDVVVIGVGTALADDPQLTVRRVAGPNPARAVVDPHGRLPRTARLFAADGVRRLVLTSDGGHSDYPPGVEVVRLAANSRHIAPAAILAALAERGLRRILIEGGADTVSRFLAAGCLDRLHIVIAPIIIGAGPSSATLTPIASVDRALRAPMRVHALGEEVLLDCDLSAQRVSIGVANRSR